ncbi:MAG TPA: efflux RND transporter permease subunit [Kofleriaceae bacterium]|nr:efflux RND transporter permease subunit [Kofleriaceae bacterium]
MRHMLAMAAVTALVGCGSKSRDAARCEPAVIVEVAFPGASAMEVEQGVVLALEEVVRRAGPREMHAVAEDGRALLLATPRGAVDAFARAVREGLQQVTTLPEAAGTPMVSVATPGPMVLVSLRGDMELAKLGRIADMVRHRLVAAPGVLGVDRFEGGEPVLRIELDPRRLAAVGLDLEAVASAVRGARLDAPAGSIRGGREFVVRGVLGGVSDLGETIISAEPVPIRLGDVAAIRESAAPGVAARVDGAPTALLLVRLAAADTPIAIDPNELPAGIDIAVLRLPGKACAAALGLDQSFPASSQTVHLRIEPVAGTAPRDSEALLDRIGTDLTAALRDAGIDGSVISLARPHPQVAIVTRDAAAGRTAASLAAGLRYPGATIVSSGGDRITEIVRLTHPDHDLLIAAAGELGSGLEGAWMRTANARVPTLSVRLDDRAHSLGITAAQLATVLRAAAGELEVARMWQGEAERRVVIGFGDGSDSVDQLLALPVAAPGGQVVPLSSVATLERELSAATIERHDGHRVTHVVTSRAPGEPSLAERLRETKAALTAAHPGLALELVTP